MKGARSLTDLLWVLALAAVAFAIICDAATGRFQ